MASETLAMTSEAEHVERLMAAVAQQQVTLRRLEELLVAHHASALSRVPPGVDCPACLKDGYWNEPRVGSLWRPVVL